jgi:hypothetical protein
MGQHRGRHALHVFVAVAVAVRLAEGEHGSVTAGRMVPWPGRPARAVPGASPSKTFAEVTTRPRRAVCPLRGRP